ncbi:MAG: type IV pilin protein [Planctomycetota bacterium]
MSTLTRPAVRGFTLIELIVVVSVLGLIAVIAIPNFLDSKLQANEVAAIDALRLVAQAQTQFQARAIVDRDGDGIGEFGGFMELAGMRGPRGPVGAPARPPMSPPILTSGSFQTVHAPWGHVERNGYLFQMYLPQPDGRRYPERVGQFHDIVDMDLAEVTWCCYAWPRVYSQSGRRTFCVNQTGTIVMADADDYSGSAGGDNRPEWSGAVLGAAFDATNEPKHARAITGRLAIGKVGYDGHLWHQVK